WSTATSFTSWWTWPCLATRMASNGWASGVRTNGSRSGGRNSGRLPCGSADLQVVQAGHCPKEKGSRGSLFFWLHVGIVGAAGTFRRHPGDVLGRILDVAGLAVHAVLRIDLEALAAVIVGD